MSFFTERFKLLAYLWNGRVFLLLNLAIISSAVSSPFFTFSTAILNAKPSCRFQLIRRLSHFRVRFFQLNRGLNRLFSEKS